MTALGLFCFARVVDGRLRSTGVPVTAQPPPGVVQACEGIRCGPQPQDRATPVRRWSGASRPPSTPKRTTERSELMSAIFGETLTFGQAKGPDVQLEGLRRRALCALRGPERLHGRLRRRAWDSSATRGLRQARSDRLACRSSAPPPAGLARHLQESPEADHTPSPKRGACAGPRSRRRGASEEIVRTFGPNQGLLEGRVLSIGAVKGLTILVNFQDVTSTVTRADVDAMLNGDELHRATATSARRASISGGSRAASSTTRTSSSGRSSSAATANSTSTICWSKRRCSSPSRAAST